MYRNWPNRLPLCIIKCKYFNLCSITIGSISVIYRFSQAKSEALVNNTCKQKKLNRVMLNGDDNENGFKTNRSN